MNTDELRLLRLRRFDNVGNSNNDSSSTSNNSHNDSTSTSNNSKSTSNNSHNDSTSFSPEIIAFNSRQYADIQSILWVSGGATIEDMERWYEQGFEFYDHPSFGLKQSKGGPCGILAAVQAEMIFEIQKHHHDSNDIPLISKDNVNDYLVTALLTILLRASTNNVIYLVSLSTSSALLTMSTNENDMIVYKCKADNIDNIKEFILKSLLPSLSSKSGSMLFLLALVLTRGIDNIRHVDMDDINTLIQQFGHCSQDLINLLLTGRATSNVWDGNISLGDIGMVIKGVAERSSVGYLTHLESLRLCTVGHNYKVPLSSVWVVGSSSHFSVLFCIDNNINILSESESLLIKIQKAFKTADKDDCGFITSTDMSIVLGNLNINMNDYDISRLRQFLSDGDIILFSTFWQHISKLMSGTSLDAILPSSSSWNNSNNNITDLWRDSDLVSDVGGRQRSDSEIARQLQAEFDGVEYIDTSRNNNKRERSHSDVAREWNNFPATTSAITNNNYSSSNSNNDKSNVAEEKSYILYHYNGLEKKERSSPLSKCTIIITRDDNTIGQPITNTNTNTSAGNHVCPIDEVIKTRFPSSKIQWEQTPPSID